MIRTNKINFKELEKWDTPTICNALDIAAPDRRLYGFTKKQMIPISDIKPTCGIVKTAHISSTQKNTKAHINKLEYYKYVSSPNEPSIIVIEDEDNPPGIGAFWGEINSAIHYSLNIKGLVTNGAVRDIDMWQKNFPALAGNISPSHAHVHVTKFGHKVNVNNMEVEDGDIIHFDKHGAVIIPEKAISTLPGIILYQQKKELDILNALKKQSFNIDILTNLLETVNEFKEDSTK